MSRKVELFLEKRAGSLENKPPHMKKYTFQKQKIKYVKYDEMRFYSNNLELRFWYGPKVEPYLDNFYSFFIPYGLDGAWVVRQ